MYTKKLATILVLSLAVVGLIFPGAALAQESDFPNQDIEIICPWSSGGGTDRTARKVAELAEEHLGVSVYVVNRTGGSGAVGHSAAAYAYPDGYTVGLATMELATLKHLGFSRVTYEDVTAVAQYNADPAAISVREDFPADNVQELIDLAKEREEKLKASHSGTGAAWHLAFAGFAREAGIADDINYLSYDGAAPAIKAVLGEEADLTPSSAVEVYPQVEAGDMKVLAVMADERLEGILPDVPTLKEEGIDYAAGTWRGLVVPEGTPEERVEILSEAFRKVYNSEEFQEFMDDQGFGMKWRGPEEFQEFLADQHEVYGGVIDQLGIGAEE